jgi:hypothetical protein
VSGDFYIAPEGLGIDEWVELKRRAVELRGLGLSYEEIAKAISGDEVGVLPAWVYKQCHPEKSTEQVRAWRRKHHPDSLHSEDA